MSKETITHAGGLVRVQFVSECMMRIERKEVRYIPSMTKNIILVGALEVQGLRGTLGEGVLKMSRGSLVILKSIRCNNLYYLMGSVVTELISSGSWMAILPDHDTVGSDKLA